MEFSRQAYWSGLPFRSPGDLPDPGIEPTLQAYCLPSEPPDLGVLLNMDSPYTNILCKIFEEIIFSDYYRQLYPMLT